MRWVSSIAIALPLAGAAWLPIATVNAAATPAPGDVVVEIKLLPRQRSPENSDSLATSSPSNAQFPSFNSQQLDRQLQRYLTYVESFGTPDILIVGSSRALQGVDPALLQQSLAQQGYPEFRAYNFGINGATAQVVNWLLQTLLTPEQLPKLIVWADGSRAFNSGRVDHTFNKITTSQGYKTLVSGTRPTVPPTVRGVQLGQMCMDLLPVPLRTQISQAEFSSERSNLTHQQERSPRANCAQPITLVVRQTKQLSASAQPAAFSESLGFQVVTVRFNPTTYFQRYPKVPGAFDADYRNFNLWGRQNKAFKDVLQFTNRRKIPLVFVNLPLTSTYIENARAVPEDDFRSHMQDLARSRQFIFNDLSTQPQLNRDQYFADPSHLNHYGAMAVSTYLGQKLTAALPNLFQRRFSANTHTSSIAATACSDACLFLPRLSIIE